MEFEVAEKIISRKFPTKQKLFSSENIVASVVQIIYNNRFNTNYYKLFIIIISLHITI